MAQIKSQAPHCQIEIQPLTAASDYRAHLAKGEVDIVIGNWTSPPDELHMARLFGDEVVCLVAKGHPAVRKKWSATDPAGWLEAEHIAPSVTHPGAKGVIDENLATLGLVRNITVRCPHFGVMRSMVASSLLAMTTGRQYCERFAGMLPVQILPCPVVFPRMPYYPALARLHACIRSGTLVARAGQTDGYIATKSIAACARKQGAAARKGTEKTTQKR